jgi:LPPG:FO 2-phospho-L-lactate transferase
MSDLSQHYVALSGGVGGAKLALGLAHVLADRLSLVVNTGDDFEHLGLYVSPDLDTALYTLAGLVNPATGWGRSDETWTFMAALAGLGGPSWFKLGDGDLATHVLRTQRLKGGATLTAVTAELARRFSISARILPMCDEPLRTLVETEAGTLAFQDYFVREQCRPRLRQIRFEAAASAKPTPQVLEALADPRLAGIIICPSNPYLSVDPILAVPGLRPALKRARLPVVAVSPIIAGRAVKGPAAKIMAELGMAADSRSVARYYAGLVDGFIIDVADSDLAADMPVPVKVTKTLMATLEDKIALARTCLSFCAELGAGRASEVGPVRAQGQRHDAG